MCVGPTFEGMRDVTGLSGSALAIHDEFKEVMDAMPSEWRDAIRLGFTDTPSPNRKMWKLIRASLFEVTPR